MNIYIKGNNIVSIRGKVWGKIFTRKDGKIEIDTVSPISTYSGNMVGTLEMNHEVGASTSMEFLVFSKSSR